MKTACLVSVLLAIVLASHAATVPPASLKFFISHDAVVGLQNVINPFLMAALKGLSIPDQSASALGIHIYLTDIVITEFTFTDQTVTFVPPNEININMPSITAQLTMNWEYKDGWLIDWTGSAVDTVSSTSASISLAVGTDSQGHATMNVASVDLSIGSLDIDLHGDHSSIFQFVVNLITPILKKVVQSEVGNVMQSKVSAMLASMFATIPIQINNVMPNVAVNFGLLPTTNVRGMQGTYYSNNHFSGSGSPVTYSDMSHINLGDYDSFDVTGYYQPPVSGNYAFQLHLDQRGEISINGFTAGELETWNIGMCWPETNTYTTSVMYLDASQYYPLRVQYQSGCGGGWVETNVCPNGTNCQSISPLSITNSPNGEVPITIWPNTIELCSATTGVYMPTGATSNAPHHAAPDTPFSDNMIDITLDDYIFNSLAWAAYEAGDLQKLVTSLPPQSPFQLNTTDFEGMIPDLYAHYPNDAMTLLISANSPPVVTVSQQSAINIAADLAINISVIANGTNITCIELDAALDIQAKAFFNSSNGTLCADINNFTLTLNEVWGPIFFNSTLLNPFFNAIISGSVIPMINQKLNAGIAIPVIDGITLGNAVIGYDDHIITLGTDFVYQPTASFIAALMPPAALAQVAALPSNNLA